ncbi:MAG: hypothetical protein IPL13_12180 [Saprospiraceae bacterium]|nr:hypothetical protein [Candidatus Brachybacter algidus]
MIRNLLIILFFSAFVFGLSAQVLLTGSTYNQDFNSLANSGTTNTTVPAEWVFLESGSSANTTYAAGTGSDNGGNTYSFGAAANSEKGIWWLSFK